MKKIQKIFAVAAAASVMSGCGKGADVIINVDGYEGIILVTENTAPAPVPIPNVSASAEVTLPEDGDENDVPADTDEISDVSAIETVHTEPTVVTEPAAWEETAASGTMYVNTDGIYSRVAAIQGSTKVKSYSLNDAVTVIAKTNTSYYKTDSGTYIHSDYLSATLVRVETTTTTAVTAPTPAETEPDVTTTVQDPAVTDLTPIMGTSVATVEQMIKFIKKMNPDVADSVIEMIPYYISEGEKEGVRGDIAFAQSCVETAYFKFDQAGTGSAVTIDQNNFCGMGVTALGLKGESFDTPQLGIRAQIQHLKAYGSTLPLNGECVDPRFQYVVRGCAEYVDWLGMQENPTGRGWAGGKNYGPTILNIYYNILSM